MSALTDRIAAEHMPTRTSACTCGGMQLGEYFPRHLLPPMGQGTPGAGDRTDARRGVGQGRSRHGAPAVQPEVERPHRLG